MSDKDNNKGWYQKYIVAKVDGSEVDERADYFVLRVDKDKHARKALLAYAKSVAEENPTFAADLINKVRDYEKQENQNK